MYVQFTELHFHFEVNRSLYLYHCNILSKTVGTMIWMKHFFIRFLPENLAVIF